MVAPVRAIRHAPRCNPAAEGTVKFTRRSTDAPGSTRAPAGNSIEAVSLNAPLTWTIAYVSGVHVVVPVFRTENVCVRRAPAAPATSVG